MAPVPFDPAPGAAGVAYLEQGSMFRAPMAGFLAWLVPGLGHIYVGQRARGWVCLVTITATFWTGVAIGGVQTTVDPHERTLWFLAQLCTGGNAGAAYALHCAADPARSADGGSTIAAHWLSTDVAIHYTGVAGLLNLLVILDALARADRPTTISRIRRRRPRGVT